MIDSPINPSREFLNNFHTYFIICEVEHREDLSQRPKTIAKINIDQDLVYTPMIMISHLEGHF